MFTLISVNEIESLTISVTDKKKKSQLICNIYRNPKSKINFFDNLSELTDILYNFSSNLTILGDFNCDYYKINDPSSLSAKLASTVRPYNLQQLISSPTRTQTIYTNDNNPKTTSTILDLIFTNLAPNSFSYGVIHNSVADHSLVFISITSIRKPSLKSIKLSNSFTRNFKHFNKDNFVSDLQSVNWKPVLDSNDPNTAIESFNNSFLQISMPFL